MKEGKMKNKLTQDTAADQVFIVLVYAVLTFIGLMVLLPLLNVVACSFSSSMAVATYKVYIWPVGLNFRAYREIFNLKEIWLGYGNSFLYMVVGTAINLFVTILAAYPLSKKNLDGRNIIMVFFTFTMFFSGGLIPEYLVARGLGLVNNRLVMIILGALSVYNMIIMRTYFMNSIPAELTEAAEIDGASHIRQLIFIVLPLSMPVIAVLGLNFAIGHWNGYVKALIYLNDINKYPLQLIIRDYLLSNRVLEDILIKSFSGGLYSTENMGEVLGLREVVKYAIIVVATLPMIVIYPFVQRYFVKGVMIGSLKG